MIFPAFDRLIKLISMESDINDAIGVARNNEGLE